MLRRVLVVLAALLLPCCVDLAQTFDAPIGQISGSFTPVAPAPPAAAEAPRTACPPGWGLTVTEGAAACEPWVDSADAGCAAGLARFPGDSACGAVGPGCPTGEWPVPLPVATRLLFVESGAAAGGTGTQSAPFSKISDALGVSTAGTTVLVAQGSYLEAVRVPAGVALQGVCAEKTLVSGPPAGAQVATLTVLGAGVEVRSLTLGGPTLGFLARGAGVSARVVDLIISEAGALGIYAGDGASLTGEGLVVRNTRPDGSGKFGRGVSVEFNGTLELNRAVFENNFDSAVNVANASTVKLSHVALSATSARPFDASHGNGLAAHDGSFVFLDQVLVTGNAEVGVYLGSGSHLVLSQSVIRSTRPSADQPGIGLLAEEGSLVSISNSLLDNNRGYGLQVRGVGSLVQLTDSIVRSTQADAVGEDGVALSILQSGRLEATRVSVERSRTVGILIDSAGSASLTDVSISQTASQASDGIGGYALQVHGGAALKAERLSVDHSAACGLFAAQVGTTFDGTDLTVRNTVGQPNGVGGWGVVADLGAAVNLSRLALEENRSVGVLASGAQTSLALTDLWVKETRGDSRGDWGRGAYAQSGASLTLVRARLERSREIGVGAYLASVTGQQVLIDQTLQPDCVANGCEEFGAGVLSNGASIVLDGFRVSGSATSGVSLGNDGGIDLSNGEVSFNQVGVTVQTADFDLARLQHDVVFKGNVQKLVTTGAIPLPDSALPVPQ